MHWCRPRFLKSSFTGFPRALDSCDLSRNHLQPSLTPSPHINSREEAKENDPAETGCCVPLGLVYLIVSGLEGYFLLNIMYHQFCAVPKMADRSPVSALPFFQLSLLQSRRIGASAVNRIFPWVHKHLRQTHIKHKSSLESALGITYCPRIFKMNVHFMVQIGPNLSRISLHRRPFF